MGLPTKRKPQNKPTPKKTNNKVRVKRKASKEPRKLSPVVSSNLRARDLGSMALHKTLGESVLAPYVWITLEGDEERELKIETGQSLDLWPSRRGLRSLTLKNEFSKFPTVKLEIYVPDYRQENKKGSDNHPARPLHKFRVGKRFSVKWGYRSAHTQWGKFTIVKRNIEFSQGTALLVVEGKLGNKLSSTTTSEVFSTTFGKSSIDQLAELAGVTVEYKSILQKEYDAIFNSTGSSAISAGNTVAATIWKECQKADVDMIYDPNTDSLRLVTPFLFDLIGEGAKPIKMTYGFPTSPIESLELETKYPKRAGTGYRSTKGLKDEDLVGINIKNGTALVLIKGSVPEANGRFITYGYADNVGEDGLPTTDYHGVTAFSNDNKNKTIETTGSNVILNAEKKYPPANGYVVRINTALNRVRPPAQEGFYHVLVYRKVKVPAINQMEVFVDSLAQYKVNPSDETIKEHYRTTKDIKTLTKQAEDGQILFEVTGGSKIVGETRYYPVKVYRNKKARPTPRVSSKTATKQQRKTTTTQTTSTNLREDLSEGEEATFNTQLPPEVFKQAIREMNNNQKTDERGDYSVLIEKTKKKIRELRAAGLKTDVNETMLRLNESLQFVQITYRRPESAKDNQSSSGSAPAPTASQDGVPRGPFTPVAATSGIARSSKRKSLHTLKIKMKVGDWTLRVGTLIDLVDVFKTINGIYYIHSEEHTIDGSGFHTEIECKKATSRQVSSYGRKKSKGTRKPGSGEKQEISKAQSLKSSIAQQHIKKGQEQRVTVLPLQKTLTKPETNASLFLTLGSFGFKVKRGLSSLLNNDD